jgi:cell division protease FtsH
LNQFYKKLAIWLAIGIVAILIQYQYRQPDKNISNTTILSYTKFKENLDKGKIPNFTLEKNQATWTDAKGKHFMANLPANPSAIDTYLAKGVDIEIIPNTGEKSLFQQLFSIELVIFLFCIWYFFIRGKWPKRGKGIMAFGKTEALVVDGAKSDVTFEDVAGIDEAKEELIEIVDFLKDPTKFTEAGARIPTGVLLYGEPGTGKTMLAKAIAGEAGVTFFSMSGSSFVEIYAGVGASRVRDLFKKAKKKSPCIIFIDEIDAVGKHRGAGGNDEREQTLNQLLVEMDGFEISDEVILVAATNRLDTLDSALLRPGRFDRQVLVPLPDVVGREHILKVHAGKVKVADNIDWQVIAKGTPGFSGAELANMVNEATLIDIKSDTKVGIKELELAKDKVMMGAERRSMIISDKDKEITAYHEIGHALVAVMIPGTDKVTKVSIIPRGMAMGQTMQVPEADKYSHSCTYLFNKICILLGGRIAEELIYQELSTGCANDIERASEIARRMVCEWGMHEDIGPIVFKNPGQPGLSGPTISEKTAEAIDAAVKDLIDRAYNYSSDILGRNISLLNDLAQELIEKETISDQDIKRVMDRKSHLHCLRPSEATS